MFLIHVHNSCSCNLNFLLAAHKPDVPERRTKHKQAMNNFLHRDNHASQNDSTQEHFPKTAHMAIQKANKSLYSTAISRKLCVRERNYTAHMHKQKAAFVRLGRSLGIFSLKCKSTLQRCPKKVTIIISISSIFRHVHALNSCTQFMFMQSLFFASCAQTRSRRKRNKTQASHAQLSSPWQSCINAPQHPRTLSEDSPHGHPESKQITVQHSHFQKAVCKGTELHSTDTQTACSFRQTGAVTWHLLTEMQKHSPKVS